MKPARTIFALVTALTLALPAAAQDQDYRMEVGAAVGASFYNGDLNHAFYGNTSAGGGLMARWHLNPRMAVKGMLTYDAIKGSAADASQFYPVDPNSGAVSTDRRDIKLSDGLMDLSFAFEYNFWPLGYIKGYEDRSRLTPFVQLGAGVTYSKAGKAFAPNLAIGVGVKYKLAPRWNIGLDWTWHFTTSDKLDNLEAPLGISSSGFTNKDDYCLTMFYITYDIFPICSTCNKD